MSKYVTSVTCVKIDKKTRRNKALTFTLSVTWSDGCKEDNLQRQYVALFDFHGKLTQKYKDNSEVCIPVLPAAKKFGRSFLREASFEKKKAIVEEFFQKILQLPPYISRGETVREFFEFVWSPDGSEPAPAETVNFSPADDLGHYESIGDDGGYASVRVAVESTCYAEASSTSRTNTTTADSDAAELTYVTVQSYTKRKSGEVTLQQGSTVSVLQRELSGWWFVQVQDTDEQGWAPASCLLPENREQLVDIVVTGPVGEFKTRCDYESIEPDVLSFKKEQPVEVLEARLDGWWKVKCDGKVGLTPATHLEPVDSEKAESRPSSVYHHVGLYRKLSPPPRRNGNESVEELYAKVNKTDKPVHITNSVPSASTAAVCTKEAENMYSQIEPAVQLSSEDYKSTEMESVSNDATEISRHSYVNIPRSASMEPSSRPHTAQPVTQRQASTKLGSSVRHTFMTNHNQQKPGASETDPSCTADDEVSTSRADTLPSSLEQNQFPVNRISVQQPNRGSLVPTGQLYVLKMERAECERLLNLHGKQRQYIVRESKKAGCPYALSVLGSDRVHHVPIELTPDNKFYIGQYSFDSMAQVVAYYSQSALCYTSDGRDVVLGAQFVRSDDTTSFPPTH